MVSNSVGRNDPCPCGSSRKYKKCCLDSGSGVPNPAKALNEELREALEGMETDSLEAMQAEAERFMLERNAMPVDDFHGLTPEQMQQMLYAPFDSPALVHFSEMVPDAVETPFARLFLLLAEAIGEKGVKPTAKGNLPRVLTREVAMQFLGDEGYAEATRFGGINKEEDFNDLHVLRLVAELAGLLRKHKGRFILSRDCRSMLSAPGVQAVYPRLFRTYVGRFNWAYDDGYEELPFIQHSFLFSLYLLWRYGDEPRQIRFYEEAYLRAFPVLLEEVEDRPYASAEETLARCYSLRTFERFAQRFGLAQVERRDKADILSRDITVRNSGLLGQLVSFA